MDWNDFLRKGVWVGKKYEYGKYDRIFHTPSKKFEFVSGNLKSLLLKKGNPLEGDLSYLPNTKKLNS